MGHRRDSERDDSAAKRMHVRASGRALAYGYEVSDPNQFEGERTWLAGQAAGDWGRDTKRAAEDCPDDVPGVREI